MTVICGGGTSELKPNVGTVTVVTMAAIEAALTFLSEGAALILAPAIAGATWDLTAICSTDPPSDPGLTATDLLDIVNFADPSVSLPAIAKARQWFLSWYWYYVCQCHSVSTPAAPTPSNPGTFVSNPGLPSSPNQNCFDGTATQDFPKRTSAGISTFDLTGLLLPVAGAGVTHNVSYGTLTGVPVTIYPIPSTPTDLIVSGNQLKLNSGELAAGHAGIFFIAWNLADSATGSRAIVDAGSSSTGSPFQIIKGFAPWPSGATHWAIVGSRQFDTSSTSDEILSAATNVHCGGPPLGLQCCPPDPNIDTRLNQILGLLQGVWNALPTPINSYASGTVHSGLTGSGTITLTGTALAIQVEITTIPPPIGSLAGTPTAYFNAGWLSPVINSAPMASVPITHSPQFIPLPSLTEQIGYTLVPGQVVKITELVRGP